MAKVKAQEEASIEFEQVTEGSGTLVDLSGVNHESSFPVLPRGNYAVVVDDLQYGISNNGGNPMWTWLLEVTEGDFAGQKLFYHTVFTEKGLPRVKRALMIMGQDDLLSRPFDPEQVAVSGVLLGCTARARVDVRPYEGKDRNSVRDLLPSQEGVDFLG